MHDSEFEDRLSRVLRSDVEALPFTLTADVVERRWAERRRARRSRYAVLAAAASVAIVVGGGLVLSRPSNGPIGGTPVPSASGQASGPSSIPSPTGVEALLYSCGGPTFSADLFAVPGNAHLEDDPPTAALRAFLASGGEAETLPDTGWYVVARSTEEVAWVAHVPGQDPQFASATARLLDGAWQIDGFGQCRPELVLDGLNVATWTLDPSVPPPGPDATSFVAFLPERACASGQAPGDRLLPPTILYEPDRVVVIFTVRPQSGNQDCQGNPSTPVTVELAEPLGSRRLLDGALLPQADPMASPTPPAAPQIPVPPMPKPSEGTSLLVELLGSAREPSVGGSGTLPPGTDAVVLQLVCSGPDAVEVDVDGRHLVYDCGDGLAEVEDHFVPRADLETLVRIDGFRSSFAALIGTRDLEAVPDIQFVAPPATLSAPGADAQTGAAWGCLSYALAAGGGGGDQCGPMWYSMPDDRVLDVPLGTEVRFAIDGWTVTKLVGEYAPTNEVDETRGAPTPTPLVEVDGPSSSVSFAAPNAAGDWAVQLFASAERGGDSFTTSYFFRVRVTP